jgi:hypothetical protein
MNTTHRITLALLVSALVGLAGSRTADAGTAWSSNGASCTVAAGSGSYSVNAGTVHVTNGNTVTLYCPVSYSTGLSGLTLLTIEADHQGLTVFNGRIDQAYVRAEVVAMSRSTGAESVLYTFFPGSSSTYLLDDDNFSLPAMNFDANFYYVRVTINVHTSVSGYDQTFYGVALSPGIP